MSQNGNDKPIARVKISDCSVSIWKNPGQFGPMYSCKLTRSYQDAEGVWQNTDTLNFSSLLSAVKAMDQAHSYINALKIKDREEAKKVAAVQAAEVAKANATSAQPVSTGELDWNALPPEVQARYMDQMTSPTS